MTLYEQMARERKVANQIDGHYCMDWDGMAVSAWTPEYDCCASSCACASDWSLFRHAGLSWVQAISLAL